MSEIRFSLSKLLKILDDPKYPCLGPNIWILTFTGLWYRDFTSKLAKFKRFYLYMVLTLYLTQYIRFVMKFDVASVMLLLQYAPFHIGIVKVCFFLKDYKKWQKLIGYISDVERKQISDGDEEINKIISEYINRSRLVSYCFWALPVFVNPLMFAEPFKNIQSDGNTTRTYQKILDIYTPYGEYPPGYYVSMVIQTLMGCTTSAYIVSWDTLVCVTMIFFAAQLKITRLMCSRIIDKQNVQKSCENITECHKFYTALVSKQRMFNNLISPVMFVNLFVTSINFGVNIIEIARMNDLATLTSGVSYLGACLIQLFVFYWHSNEVTVESDRVSYGTFESDWSIVNYKLQREVVLLAITTSKILLFAAGPFNDLTLSTFLGIIRASYSFYALLSKTNN